MELYETIELDEARGFWENHLLPKIIYEGAKPSPSLEAIKLLAEILKKRKFLPFHDEMTVNEINAIMADDENVVERARKELSSCFERIMNRYTWKELPNDYEIFAIEFQAIMRIANILGVKANVARE